MAHPEFVRLFARTGDLVLAATARTEQGAVLYPFILRPLSAEPWHPPGQTGWDLTSAYGYGGPFAWKVTAAEAAEFWAQFDAWARAREVVTSFARLSVFPDQLLPFDGEVVVDSPTASGWRSSTTSTPRPCGAGTRRASTSSPANSSSSSC